MRRVHTPRNCSSLLGKSLKIRSKTRFRNDEKLILVDCGKDFVKTAELDSVAAEEKFAEVAQRVNGVNLEFKTDGEGLRRALSVGRYFTKRYLFWVRVEARPGSYLRIEYSYRTRFAAEYEAKKLNNLFGLVSVVKKFVGQEPSYLLIPVSRHGLTDSYHFEIQVPEDSYITHQSFALESDKGKSLKKQKENFRNYAAKEGSAVEGDDEAGGSFAHLYAHKLPSRVGEQVFASIHVRERPPGTTAIVLWLSVFSAISAAILHLLWPSITRVDLRGIDLAAIFAALPGLAAAWFSRIFQNEGRYRVPMVSRAGLMLSGIGTVYLIVAVLLQRGLCGVGDEQSGRPPCPRWAEAVSSQNGLLIAMCLLSALALVLFVARVQMHVKYRNCQKVAVGKYGR